MIKQAVKTHLRWMIKRDMPEVLAIEDQCFQWDAWTEQGFLTCLRERNCVGMVAEYKERVAGYMIYELHQHHLHIVNFAVHPALQRKQVGTQMAQKLKDKLSTHKRTFLDLVVRETNLAAHLFWKSQGFQAVEVLNGFFARTDEDAYHFEFHLKEPSHAD